MYQRNKLGQDEFTTFEVLPEDYSFVDPNQSWDYWTTPNPDVYAPASIYDTTSLPAYSPPAPMPAPAPVDSGWSWSSIWQGIAPVIQTGAEAFSKIYPAITGKTAGGQAVLPTAPKVGTVWPSNQPVPTGYTRDPFTGQLRLATAQAGITASPYFWPVTLGLGALFLMSQSSPKRRR